VAVASAGLYASLHPMQTTTPTSHQWWDINWEGQNIICNCIFNTRDCWSSFWWAVKALKVLPVFKFYFRSDVTHSVFGIPIRHSYFGFPTSFTSISHFLRPKWQLKLLLVIVPCYENMTSFVKPEVHNILQCR